MGFIPALSLMNSNLTDVNFFGFLSLRGSIDKVLFRTGNGDVIRASDRILYDLGLDLTAANLGD